MTAQPDMTGFGRPPAAPSGFRKFAPFIAGAATGGFVLMIGLYAAQVVMPQRLSPGGVAGDLAGAEQATHLRVAGDEQISYDTRRAAAEKALGVTTEAMQGAATIASTADVLCGASRIGQTFAGSQRTPFDRNSDAAWWENLFRDVGSASCGVGSQIRNGIIGEVTDNGRQSGTLSIRDAQQAHQQARPTQIASVEQAFNIMQASRHYSNEEWSKARDIFHHQSAAIQNALTERLRNDDPDAPDVFAERTLTYARITNNY